MDGEMGDSGKLTGELGAVPETQRTGSLILLKRFLDTPKPAAEGGTMA